MTKYTSFNNHNRIRNSSANAITGVINNVTVLLLSFVFRTVFIKVLSEQYLGINGLFTNILNLLSFAELGIGSCISYRLYQPIANDDPVRVAMLMDFYKKIYRIIASVVLIVGLCLIPLLKFFIKDLSEVPLDVNIYVIYFLFLMSNVTSYFFNYRLNLLIADQKTYKNNIFTLVKTAIVIGAKISILFLTKNFTALLIAEIVIGLVLNFVYSFYVKKQYSFVFDVVAKLDRETKKAILKDTTGMLSYKIGDSLAVSIDNILLSSFVGISIVGLYSNYSLIMTAVCLLLAQILSASTASLGNLKQKADVESYRKMYEHLHFINLWLVSCAIICFYVLINPFISVWLGDKFLFDKSVVAVISASTFCSQIRHINCSIIDTAGLFTKQKWRPIAEQIINLVTSIILVQFIGISGIFIGTIVSRLVLQMWLEPCLIYKTQFQKKPTIYFIKLAFFAIFTLIVGYGLGELMALMDNSLGFVILKFVITMIVPSILLGVMLFWTKDFKYFWGLIIRICRRIKRKFTRKSFYH